MIFLQKFPWDHLYCLLFHFWFWALFHNLAKILSVVFICSKNKLSFISFFCSILFILISFIFALIFIISFLLLTSDFVSSSFMISYLCMFIHHYYLLFIISFLLLTSDFVSSSFTHLICSDKLFMYVYSSLLPSLLVLFLLYLKCFPMLYLIFIFLNMNEFPFWFLL